MGGGNPMFVDKFSYKAEFQARGAAHVHGTLWVKTHLIEDLRKIDDGNLFTEQKYENEELDKPYTQPFNGITKAFETFRNRESLKPMKKLQS